MSGMFCRHNRLTANCVICSREQRGELKRKAPPRPGRARCRHPTPLTPGLRAPAGPQRLAVALPQAAERLDPPGPYPEVAAEPDLEQATWLAFPPALARHHPPAPREQ